MYVHVIILYVVDSNEQQICNALASLVAVTLACPDQSNHLWYHLYSPEFLEDTQITGFLVICSCIKISMLLCHTCSLIQQLKRVDCMTVE